MLSKWTAVNPQRREKHFLVTRLLEDDEQQVIGCILEAVISHQEYQLHWRELQDEAVWRQGWL